MLWVKTSMKRCINHKGLEMDRQEDLGKIDDLIKECKKIIVGA